MPRSGTNAVCRVPAASIWSPSGRGRVRGSALTVAIRVEGQASKRGMIPRLPAADRLIADARDWLTTEYAPLVRASGIVANRSSSASR